MGSTYDIYKEFTCVLVYKILMDFYKKEYFF